MLSADSDHEATAQIAAMLPYVAGYHPTPGQVGIIGLLAPDADGLVGASMGVVLPAGIDPTKLPDIMPNVRAALDASDSAAAVVVGYEQQSAPIAAMVTADLAQRSDLDVLGQARQRGDGEIAVYPDTMTRDPLPDADLSWERIDTSEVAATRVLAGAPTPAPDRDAYINRYSPLAQPSYQAAPADAVAQMNATPPSERVELAVRTLDALTAASEPDHQMRSQAAHLLTTDKNVRDAVLARDLQAPPDPARTEAIVQLWRGAPQEYQSKLAGFTAARLLINQGDSIAAYQVGSHGQGEMLAELIGTATQLGVSPAELKQWLIAPSAGNLADADRAWRAAQLRQSAFPSPATDATRTPPTPKPQQPGRGRPEPGTEHGTSRD